MFITNITNDALSQALRGLDAQRQIHEQNIANVETPGYLAQTVDFASSLRRALKSGDISQAGIEVETSKRPTRLDGNNVRLDQELTGLTQTQLHQDLVIAALNSRYRLLRTAWGK